MVHQGESPIHSTLMLSGFSARYTMLSARRISVVHVPGDFVDLHSLLLRPMDHSVLALTDCQVVEVPHALLREISETHPHLTRLLWTLTVIDAAIFHSGWSPPGTCRPWGRFRISSASSGRGFRSSG